MKICAACLEGLPREGFSKRQWKMQQYQRRCKGCIDVDQPVQLKAPAKEEPNRDFRGREQSPPAAVDREEATCWFCLGPEESGQPLKRDCSCRGDDAGFAHLSCLIGYAKHESENWDGEDIGKFSEPWGKCSYCHQNYQNALSVELAAEFVSFVESTFPGDRLKLLEALWQKMCVLTDSNLGEAKETGHKMLSIIDGMQSATHPLSLRTIHIEMGTRNCLGAIHLEEGTKESAALSLEHFEKSRDMCIKLGYSAEEVARMDGIVTLAKRRCEGGSECIEETLERNRAWYNRCVARDPEGDPFRITAGLTLASALRDANREVEAETLLAKLLDTCKRVHGSDHSLTKDVERALTE